MEIYLSILNTEAKSEPTADVTTWHSRNKSYKSDCMDEDMKNCCVGQKVDRIILNDVQIATRSTLDEVIEFLTKSRESFNH